MKKETLKWGCWGAAGVVSSAILLAGVQSSLSYDSGPRAVVHKVIVAVVSPVMTIWEAIFQNFGVTGDQGLRFIVPVFASIGLYLAAIGFCFGALLRKAVKPT
jgi:hypothetical protein